MPSEATSFSEFIDDPAVLEVLTRLYDAESRYNWDSDDDDGSPYDYTDVGFSIYPEQGDFLYLLARFGKVSTVVEFATSLGFSSIYFAAALRDNGGGTVYGSELVPAKAAQAKHNIADAGLSDFVTIAVGDARETLADVPGPIDLALIDGWPTDHRPSLAVQVLQTIEAKLRPGAIVVNDNGEEDYLAYVSDPANGYKTVTMPWKGSTEVSLKI